LTSGSTFLINVSVPGGKSTGGSSSTASLRTTAGAADPLHNRFQGVAGNDALQPLPAAARRIRVLGWDHCGRGLAHLAIGDGSADRFFKLWRGVQPGSNTFEPVIGHAEPPV
jgi:hypothetical protein